MNTRLLVNQTTQLYPNFQWLNELLKRWNRNINTRHKLLEMDDDQLKDIGIDRKAAIAEGRKPFWR